MKYHSLKIVCVLPTFHTVLFWYNRNLKTYKESKFRVPLLNQNLASNSKWLIANSKEVLKMFWQCKQMIRIRFHLKSLGVTTVASTTRASLRPIKRLTMNSILLNRWVSQLKITTTFSTSWDIKRNPQVKLTKFLKFTIRQNKMKLWVHTSLY